MLDVQHRSWNRANYILNWIEKFSIISQNYRDINFWKSPNKCVFAQPTTTNIDAIWPLMSGFSFAARALLEPRPFVVNNFSLYRMFPLTWLFKISPLFLMIQETTTRKKLFDWKRHILWWPKNFSQDHCNFFKYNRIFFH